MSQSLYDQIGGSAAVDAAVDIFYEKVLADGTINGFFKNVDMKKQRAQQKAFLTMVFGGPNGYSGKDLRSAHAPLVAKGLGDLHFDAVAKHLQATLDQLNVPVDLKNQIMTIAGSVRDDVLGR
jgi:hemoglobin